MASTTKGDPTRVRTTLRKNPVRSIAELDVTGVTTLSVALFVADAETGARTLRTVAEALELAGVGD